MSDEPKKLISLSSFNENATSRHIPTMAPQLNGIECPRCRKELFDTHPMVVLTSDPPKKSIHCSHCGYVGYRYC